MENSAQALHNAVRRYCYDQHRHWCDVYASIPKDDSAGTYRYSSKQKDVFPRYNVLNAIRVAVESIDPEQIDNFTPTQEMLDSLGDSADDGSTPNPIDEIVRNAQHNERQKYCEFVRSLSTESVWLYDPLPYQRVLYKSESDDIWQALSQQWSIDRGASWYPLAPTSSTNVAAFDADAFHGSVPSHAVVRLLDVLDGSRVYELREYGPNYILDNAAVSPVYNGAEGFWTTANCQWVLYASHESFITLAGSVLDRVKTIWPTWAQHELTPLW